VEASEISYVLKMEATLNVKGVHVPNRIPSFDEIITGSFSEGRDAHSKCIMGRHA